MAAPLHECPGGCGAQVEQHLLACKPCWFRVPSNLRRWLLLTYRIREKNPASHDRALRAVLVWYRENPRGAVS